MSLKALINLMDQKGYYFIGSNLQKINAFFVSKEFIKELDLEKSKMNIQRFKGLGEMNPEELWSTTLNPETRNLLQVQYSKNSKKDQELIHTLMGNDVALRKDFIISEYQIYESKLIGADCILLIASILDDDRLLSYSKLATELNLDFIIEVHDQEELDRAKVIKDSIIGVNNRNLKTFEVDLMNAVRLRKNYDGNQIFIAESGIKSSADIEYLVSNDINVFLIGESLMRGNLF